MEIAIGILHVFTFLVTVRKQGVYPFYAYFIFKGTRERQGEGKQLIDHCM